MARNLLIAALVIAALCAALVFVANRADPGHAGSSQSGASVDDGLGDARRRVRELQERSRALMPPSLDGVYLGMPLDELRRVRTAAQLDTNGRGPQGETVWAEDAQDGARYVFLLIEGSRAAEGQRLAQVQALSRISREAEIAGHFRALQDRYGPPTGTWDCPETENSSPMRRFTWRRETASVMEALLLYNDQLAVTLVIAATDDVGAALRRARCRSMRPDEDVANFPVARSLRGDSQNSGPGSIRIAVPSGLPSGAPTARPSAPR